MPSKKRSPTKRLTLSERTTRRQPKKRPRVIAIVGPTGSGKTALAVKLVRTFGGVVISADSRQMYKEMDIGTAKPTRAEQRVAKHYMIDITKPNQRYSAGRFQRAVYALVKKLTRAPTTAGRSSLSAGRPSAGGPIFLVGGSYLYVDAVLKGLDFAHTKADPAERKRLESLSLKQLQRELRRRDPLTARTIDMHNPRRLVRALEVVAQTGRSFYGQRHTHPPEWDVLWIGLLVPQAELDRRNRRRIDQMFRQGWAREVTRLAKKYRPTAPGFYAHGYREVLDYTRGKRSLAETKERIAINTRHHAKRQMSWFKKNPAIKWIKPSNVVKARALVGRFLAG